MSVFENDLTRNALLENGLSDIRCCYHSNIYQIYISDKGNVGKVGKIGKVSNISTVGHSSDKGKLVKLLMLVP